MTETQETLMRISDVLTKKTRKYRKNCDYGTAIIFAEINNAILLVLSNEDKKD